MARPVWPGSLPQYVLARGYQEKFPDATIETPMELGPVKIRRRYTGRNRVFTISADFTPAQYATFEQFHDVTVAAGSLPFEWVHPRTRVMCVFRFRKPAPVLTLVSGTVYTVQMTLESLT